MNVGHVVAAATLLALVAGCSGPDEDEAAGTARSFVTQVSQSPDAACRLLAPATVAELEQSAEKQCPQALADLGIDAADDVLDTEVYSMEVQVDLPNQVVFLSRFDDGWKVVAAGCTTAGSHADVPYICLLKGR